MANFISVESEINDVQNRLSETAKSIKTLQRKTLGVIGRQVVKSIRDLIKASGLKKRTGELQKSYRYKIKKNLKEANVFPLALDKNRKIYPKIMALSYGSEVRNIRPRFFVQNAKSKAETKGFDKEIEKMIEKELKKYWG